MSRVQLHQVNDPNREWGQESTLPSMYRTAAEKKAEASYLFEIMSPQAKRRLMVKRHRMSTTKKGR